MISKYFFDTANECCAAYYNTEGEGGEECVVENVCEGMKIYPDMKNGVCIETYVGDAGEQSFDTLEGCVSSSCSVSFHFGFFSCHFIFNQYIKTNSLLYICSLNIYL